MNRGVLKKNLIALVCAAVVAIALLLPAGLQGMIAPSNVATEAAIVQADGQETPIDLGVSPDAAILPEIPEEPIVTSDAAGDPPQEPEYVPGEILVGLAEGATAEQLNEQLANMDYVSTRFVSEDDIMLGYVKLELVEGVSVEDATARVKNEHLVKAAQPNYVYYAQDTSPEDADYSATNLQAGDVDESELTGQSTVINDHRRLSQWALEAVHAYEAWDTVRVEGRVTVAVVDSGVNGNHEDLQGRVLAGYSAIDKSATVTDDTGHGTHVAGIIAATANNSKGVAGVSYNANILPVKVMEDNKTSTETVLAGMTYVAGLSGSNAPRVMNISIGSSSAWTDGVDSALVTALGKVHAKGILVVYAAANKTGGTATEAWESYPCDFDLNSAGNAGHPDSIGVINAQQSGSSYNRNNSSNFNTPGKKTKTLCAPGSSILSTSNGGGYVNMSGTSMAAPYVAGVAALVFAANPSLRASDVKTILEDTATDLGSEGWDDETGYGMVNAAGAVREAAGRTGGVGVGPTLNGSRSVNVGQAASLQVLNGGSRTWTWTSSAGGIAVVEGNGATATVLGVGAGQAIITATSGDGIQLSHTITVQGAAGVLANAQVTLSQSQYDYTGAECKPTPTVRVTENGTIKTLTENVDYTVSYSNNVNATTMAVVYITGKGSYASAGTLARVFTINAVPISSLEGLNVQAVETPTYDGSAKTPALSVTADGGKVLVKDVDYIVKDSDYTNNIDVTSSSSKAHVVITGTGNYTGPSEAFDFDILPATITKVELSQSTYIYSGSVCTPTVKVYGSKNGKANQLLTAGTDYTVDTPSGRKAVGTYTYTARPINNYGGSSKSATMTISKQSLKNAQVTLSYNSTAYDGSSKKPAVTVTVAGRRLTQGSDYTVSYSNNVNVGTATVTISGTSTGNYKDSYTTSFKIIASTTDAQRGHSVQYRTHVQNDGWQGYVRDAATSGTSGRGLRLEGINISLVDHPYSGSIYYSAHVQNIGWQDAVRDGTMAGTSGKGLRLEAIKIWLTDQMAAHYDVYYRVHAQNVGWMGWAKNGEAAGTAGYGYRLEAIQVVLVPKGSSAPKTNPSNAFSKAFKTDLIQYRTHVQNIGWQSYVADGAMSGTSGKSLRLEGINIRLGSQSGLSGGVQYRTHIQNIGWQGWKSNDAMSGTSGQSLRLEAIQIKLTGTVATKYDVYYRVHCQNFGWMGWAKNGESAGSAGYGYRLEGIEIKLVPKGGNAPGSTANAFRQR